MTEAVLEFIIEYFGSCHDQHLLEATFIILSRVSDYRREHLGEFGPLHRSQEAEMTCFVFVHKDTAVAMIFPGHPWVQHTQLTLAHSLLLYQDLPCDFSHAPLAWQKLRS